MEKIAVRNPRGIIESSSKVRRRVGLENYESSKKIVKTFLGTVQLIWKTVQLKAYKIWFLGQSLCGAWSCVCIIR
jgi:hypothetical protein